MGGGSGAGVGGGTSVTSHLIGTPGADIDLVLGPRIDLDEHAADAPRPPSPTAVSAACSSTSASAVSRWRRRTPRLEAALPGTTVRAWFLGHRTFSADALLSYRGLKPQHERESPVAELEQAAAWIRRRSRQLWHECQAEGQPYVDVGALGFSDAMRQARRHLLGSGREAGRYKVIKPSV